MPSKRSRFARNAFHQIAIAADRVDVEIKNVEARAIEILTQPLAGNRHSNAVAGALSQRSGGGLHSRRQVGFGMSWSPAVNLPEALDLFHRHGGILRHIAFGIDGSHSSEVQRGIQQHRGMASRQNKAVAIRPRGIGGIVTQRFLPKFVNHRCEAHRRARMAGIRLLHRVNRQSSNGIDA